MRICNPFKQSANKAKERLMIREPSTEPTNEKPSHCICAVEGLLICASLGLGCAITDEDD